MPVPNEIPLEEYTSLNLNQFSESDSLNKFIEIYLLEILELEKANIDLSEQSTNIDIAIGYQLDLLGKLVGENRQGKTDEDYRTDIIIRSLINRADATNNSIMEIIKELVSSTTANVFEHFPATAIFKTDNIEQEDYQLVSQVLTRINPAGVEADLIYQNPEIGNPLILSEQNGDFSANAILAELGVDVLGVEDGAGIEDLNINNTGSLEQLEIQDGTGYVTFNNYPVEILETRNFK